MKHVNGFSVLAGVLLVIGMYGCVSSQAGKPVGHVEGRLIKQQADNLLTLHVIGKGLPPETAINRAQADFLAERAAIADGYRQLVEKIHGVYVDSYQRSGAGMIDYDYIYLETRAWLQGAEVIEVRLSDHGLIEAHMRVAIRLPEKNAGTTVLAKDSR
ncbi:MAG: hypothetical protein CSA22_04130 [Deltaproteobacteria bacterium]|nr:MAG: hypothetical protein CSA22_04130 [Deltaproteobacteria bacterium]